MGNSRILVVDDNRDLADGLAVVLEDEEYKVSVAYTGEEAVREAREQAFDLVLMDFKLPGINGLEASRKIHRERPETRSLIMTGFRIEQLLTEVTGPGTVCTVRPPITDQKLHGALRAVQPRGSILVIGDDSRAAESVEEVFVAAGRRVALARSPEQVMDAKRAAVADVLLLDLGLPMTKSFEALFDSGDRGAAVPVVVASASTLAAPVADALRSREVTGCFFKPFELDELLEVVEELCG